MWPEGKRAAVSFSFDFDAEEVWVVDDPSYEGRPVGLSAGRYAATVAVPAVLAMLDRYGLRSTFFVPGKVAEDHPNRVREIVEAGHELAAHGYRHREPSRMPRSSASQISRTSDVVAIFFVQDSASNQKCGASSSTQLTGSSTKPSGCTYGCRRSMKFDE